MTHERLLLLLCRQLWPGFTEQLTVNWRFSSPNHLVMSAAVGLARIESAVLCGHVFFFPYTKP